MTSEGPSFSVTVPAGQLIAETDETLFQSATATNITAIISSISPSTVTKDGVSYGTQGFSGNCSETNYAQLAIEHNDALDFLHLNYSGGGPYNLQSVYNALVNYSNTYNMPFSGLSYQELMDLKNQSTGITSMITLIQNQYPSISVNIKNELINLYQLLNSASSEEEAETMLQNFDNQVNQSSYTIQEKNALLGMSPALLTIGDFWSTTGDFMGSHGETRNWMQRVNEADQTAYDSKLIQNGSALSFVGLNKKDQIWRKLTNSSRRDVDSCVYCVWLSTMQQC